MRVILVHGKSTKGRKNVDRMAVEVEARGLPVKAYKHEPVNTVSILWRRKRIARQLLNIIRSGDGPVAVVAHSAGCLFTFDVARLGAEIDAAVFFSAAMDRKADMPRTIKRLLNVTHPYDRALFAGSLIPGHPFGLYGREGHAGPYDSRITEEQSTAEVGAYNHTAPYFSPEYVGYWADRVVEFVG